MNSTINESLVSTAKDSIPDMEVQVNTLPDINDIIQFKDSIISNINSFINAFSPEYSVHIVFLFSVVIALLLKRKYEEEWMFFFIWVFVIFFSLRFIGIGG